MADPGTTDSEDRGSELHWGSGISGRFAISLSHDLRNPLSVARAQLELAKGECDSEHLDAVDRAHARMEELVDDLLALALDGGPVEAVEPVDLASLAGSCWRNVPTDGATLVVGSGRTVAADRSKLRRLFENLFRNAVEHGSTSPRPSASDVPRDAIDPEAADVTIAVGALDDGFFVADDGPGIPAEERGRAFDPGYSTADCGTGFGLAIVAEIVDAHGWEIAVTDGDEGGTRFEITGVEPEA